MTTKNHISIIAIISKLAANITTIADAAATTAPATLPDDIVALLSLSPDRS